MYYSQSSPKLLSRSIERSLPRFSLHPKLKEFKMGSYSNTITQCFNSISIRIGVKQGYPLSLIPFSVVMDDTLSVAYMTSAYNLMPTCDIFDKYQPLLRCTKVILWVTRFISKSRKEHGHCGCRNILFALTVRFYVKGYLPKQL